MINTRMLDFQRIRNQNKHNIAIKDQSYINQVHKITAIQVKGKNQRGRTSFQFKVSSFSKFVDRVMRLTIKCSEIKRLEHSNLSLPE